MSPLLPLRPEFLARLDAARELGWRFFRGTLRPGAPGAPPEEFEGYRPYAHGDDVRWIDWNLFARQEELFVKVFRADEEVEVLLLIDASPSMLGGDGRKHGAAAATAAALARLALLTGHPVRVARYAGALLDVRGPWRSPNEIGEVQRHLRRPPPAAAGTNLAEALRPLVTGRQRPLSLVVLTDAFQEAPLLGALLHALVQGVRHCSLLRVTDPEDLAPALRGHTVLRDPEGEGRRDIVGDRALEEAARRRIAHHFLLLAEGLARVGVPLLELAARRPFEEAFLAMLRAATAAAAPRAA